MNAEQIAGVPCTAERFRWDEDDQGHHCREVGPHLIHTDREHGCRWRDDPRDLDGNSEQIDPTPDFDSGLSDQEAARVMLSAGAALRVPPTRRCRWFGHKRLRLVAYPWLVCARCGRWL